MHGSTVASAFRRAMAAQCENDCPQANDGVCDDGGSGGQHSQCMFGSDCLDCGSRSMGEVLFIGDSDIEYWSKAAVSTWIAFPNSNNVGVAGFTCAQVLSELDAHLARYAPSTAVLVCGENDLISTSASTAFSRFVQVVERIIASGARVVFLSTKPEPSTDSLHAKYRDYDQRVQEYAATLAATTMLSQVPPLAVVDSYNGFEDLGNQRDLYHADGLHLSDLGYSYWSAWAQNAIGNATAGVTCFLWRSHTCVLDRNSASPAKPSWVADCDAYWAYTTCSWTRWWACPASSKPGDVGFATNDGTLGYKCCCLVPPSPPPPASPPGPPARPPVAPPPPPHPLPPPAFVDHSLNSILNSSSTAASALWPVAPLVLVTIVGACVAMIALLLCCRYGPRRATTTKPSASSARSQTPDNQEREPTNREMQPVELHFATTMRMEVGGQVLSCPARISRRTSST